jgi:glycosyltransferase involved in cell wall biosynthesis
MVVCGNQRSAELLNAEGLFRGSIEIIPQFGQDALRHQPGTEPDLRRQLGLNGSIVIGYAGRLVPEKGLRVLREALRRIKSDSWKLLLVGAGSLESEIRLRWMTEFPGRIVLIPLVPSDKVPRYLRCSDIFVLPSQSTPSWQEQFGLSLTQAMMLGLPCIGSTSGAIREVMGPGGLIFEEASAKDLAGRLEELLKDPGRREALGALGREFAMRNYTTENIAARYLGAFERAARRVSFRKEHRNIVFEI